MAAVDALGVRTRVLEFQARKGLDDGAGVCLKRIANGILVPFNKVLEFLLRVFGFSFRSARNTISTRKILTLKRIPPRLRLNSAQIPVAG